MSGGVDSAVAAARLVDAGYDTVGVTLHLWDYPDDAPEKSRCCAPEDAHDARLTADYLGIPHYTFDRRALFSRDVVDPFVAAYLDGQTPSPCVRCNRTVKMRELFELGRRLGAAHVATGHYARVGVDASGRTSLYRSRDSQKDQAYFLYRLSTKALRMLLLPLAQSNKAEVRREAHERGLPGADKGESQELCFVASGDYTEFVAKRARGRIRPGPIVDHDGRLLGHHRGVHRFTVGQRRGLGVALGKPAFVTQIQNDTVTLGDVAQLVSPSATLIDTSWHEGVSFPFRADVQVRSHHRAATAKVERRSDGKVVITFDNPVRAISPGQTAVAFEGDRVLGGGTIARHDQEKGS